MTETSDELAFHYSRIYAEGWNAARRAPAARKTTASNPYKTEPARTRWNEGFAKGVQ